MKYRDISMRVIAPPLNHGHLVDLLEGYEYSGFFRGFDERMTTLNERTRKIAMSAFGDDEAFSGGPLIGRLVKSVSVRMQTMALAPRFVIIPGSDDGKPGGDYSDSVPLGKDFDALIGVPLVVSANLRETLLNVYDFLDMDATDLVAFLSEHHGLTAVMGVE